MHLHHGALLLSPQEGSTTDPYRGQQAIHPEWSVRDAISVGKNFGGIFLRPFML